MRGRDRLGAEMKRRKKTVIFISGENTGDFLAIVSVKEGEKG